MSTQIGKADTGSKSAVKDVKKVETTTTTAAQNKAIQSTSNNGRNVASNTAQKRDIRDPTQWNRIGKIGNYEIDMRRNPVQYNTGLLSVGRSVRKSRGRKLIEYSSDSSSESDSSTSTKQTVGKSKSKEVYKTGAGTQGAGKDKQVNTTKAVGTGAVAKDKQVTKTETKGAVTGTAAGSGAAIGAAEGVKEKQVTQTVNKDVEKGSKGTDGVATDKATVGSSRGSVGNTTDYRGDSRRRGPVRLGYGSSSYSQQDFYNPGYGAPKVSEFMSEKYDYVTAGPREIPIDRNYYYEYDQSYMPRRRGNQGRQRGGWFG